MKKFYLRKVTILLSISIILISTLVGCKKETMKKIIELSEISQSTWLWDATKINSIDTLKQLKILGLDEIYVNTGWEDSKKEFYLKEHPLTYATFIEIANDQEIEVHALLSNNDWALSSNYLDFKNQVNTILSYNKKYNYTFSAVHLDIEPYLLENWESNTEKYLISYVNNLNKIKKEIDAHNSKNNDNLKLIIDIPFWFSEKEFNIKNKNVIELLLDNVDELNIMTYTKNQSYFSEWAKNVLSIADKYSNKFIRIAIELQPEIEDVSLYELSANEMIEYLKDNLKEFEKYKSFKGLAIHDYDSYIKYLEKEFEKQ